MVAILPLSYKMFGFMCKCFAPSRKHCYDLKFSLCADVSYFLCSLRKSDYVFSQQK